MGLAIEREVFADADYVQFRERLGGCLDALRAVLARPGFGVGPTTIGLELELHLVDAEGRAKPIAREIIAAARAPVTTEIDCFNLELNTAPLLLAGRPFTAMHAQLRDALAEVRRATAERGARVAAIGILPTLREEDLAPSALTSLCRYRALSAALRRVRGEPFRLAIRGDDALDVEDADVTFEGANAALQIHLRVDPERFAAVYNAAQIASAAVLACATNSPLFLGKRLWEETRIALFRQSVDERRAGYMPARVTFGHGWLRRSIVELFAESVAMHEPLLPVVDAEDPRACVAAGGVPRLLELRLHNSTSWRWNRPVYDDAAGGHVRLELRPLPSGPTAIDMVANTAFAIGATLGLAERIEPLLSQMTFGHARENFYEAARFGLDATLLWPSPASPSPAPRSAREVIASLVPIARDALVAHGVDPDEAARWLEPIERRTTTGARWQRAVFDAFGKRMGAADAAAKMLDLYLEYSERDLSVCDWPVIV